MVLIAAIDVINPTAFVTETAGERQFLLGRTHIDFAFGVITTIFGAETTVFAAPFDCLEIGTYTLVNWFSHCFSYSVL